MGVSSGDQKKLFGDLKYIWSFKKFKNKIWKIEGMFSNLKLVF